jgi:hypothetical protein
MLKSLLAHPLTCGLDLDDPRTTELRLRIIQEKSFLRQIYQEWYSTLANDLPRGALPTVELGSGAGFLKDFVPNLITSEVFSCAGAHRFTEASLKFFQGCLETEPMVRVRFFDRSGKRFCLEIISFNRF